MGVFETVEFRFVRDEGRNVLVIDARPKSWGPTFLRIGSGFEANFDGDATLALRGTVHAMQLNSRGGELKATVELGTVPGVNVELYQPLDFRGRFFTSADVSYLRTLARVSTPTASSARGGSRSSRRPWTRGSRSAPGARSGRGSSAGREPASRSSRARRSTTSTSSSAASSATPASTRSTTSASRGAGRSRRGRLEAFREELGSESSFNRL